MDKYHFILSYINGIALCVCSDICGYMILCQEVLQFSSKVSIHFRQSLYLLID